MNGSDIFQKGKKVRAVVGKGPVFDSARMKALLAGRLNTILEPYQGADPTPDVLAEIRTAIAGLLREYMITLAARGHLGEDSPLPFQLGAVTSDPETGQIQIALTIDPDWLARMPPEIREEIGALIGSRR